MKNQNNKNSRNQNNRNSKNCSRNSKNESSRSSRNESSRSNRSSLIFKSIKKEATDVCGFFIFLIKDDDYILLLIFH